MIDNRRAFLDMLAWSEGTATIAGSDNGYNVLVGGKLFDSYADHPRVKVQVRPGLVSTAAGRYQLLARYFDAYRASMKLPDFSPASQDAIALQQIRERGALPLIDGGSITDAIARVSNIWASLPGNNYGQGQRSNAALLAAFNRAGEQQ